MATCGKAEFAVFGQTRPWPQAALWLAMLMPFFFLSYGFANWVTSQRQHVPSLVFSWEHRIPFVAWTIVPYWSTDLLYALSLFLCRTQKELSIHAKRLTAAQVISVCAFLLFPLRFTFERPHPAGPFGWMFDTLASFDRPFNQAPSLHLSLTTILWASFSQHLRGKLLWLMRGWMILMGASTLTTYQHHFIDLPTGIWVGLFCIVLFPADPVPTRGKAGRDPLRFQLAAVYLSGYVLLVDVAIRVGETAWWLLWAAGALLIVGGIYFTGRPELFRKSEGVMPTAMVVLLAPYLAAAWLNSRLWTWRADSANEITDGVWLGRLPSKAERSKESTASIVDLTAELPTSAGVVYRGVPMLDLVPPTAEQLEAAVAAIEELKSKRPTLVCCALGYSRSAAAVAAWMTASGKEESLQESIAFINARRPQVALGASHHARLEEWRRARGGK
jgi:protein-tyrosine phosphatase